MKINFTKKQYRLLLDLIFAGEMTVNGYKVAGEEIEKYKELQQYVYSFSENFGFENLIEYDPKHQMFFESREFDESEINKIIDNYDDEIFWKN